MKRSRRFAWPSTCRHRRGKWQSAFKIINRLKYLDPTWPAYFVCLRVVSKRFVLHFPFRRLHTRARCPFDPMTRSRAERYFFPCQKTFAHKHWAGTGVLHVGSIPAQPFYLNTDTYRHAQRHRAGFSDKLRGADAWSRNYCSSSRIVFFSNLIWIRRWWRWNMCIHWFCCILIKSDFVVKRIPMFYLVTLCFSLFNIESTTWSRTVIALNSRQHATILMSWESGVMCLYLIEILQSRLAVAHSCEKRWDLVREPDNASRNRCDATLWRDYLSGQEHSNQRQAVRMHPHQANDGGRFLFEQLEKPKN